MQPHFCYYIIYIHSRKAVNISIRSGIFTGCLRTLREDHFHNQYFVPVHVTESHETMNNLKNNTGYNEITNKIIRKIQEYNI